MCRQSGKADCIEESDLSLILKCRGGSQTAAAALLARYAGLLHHAVSKTVVEGSDPGGSFAGGLYGAFERHSHL